MSVKKSTNAFDVLMRIDQSKKRKDYRNVVDILIDDDSKKASTKKIKSDTIEIVAIEECSPVSTDVNLSAAKSFKKKLTFPKISHVHQKASDPSKLWTLPKLLPIKNHNLELFESEHKLSQDFDELHPIKFHLVDNSTVSNITKALSDDQVKISIDHIKKLSPSSFPVYKFYKRLSLKKNNKKDLYKSFVWSDIFQPDCTSDLLHNRKCVRAIDNWLQSWLNYNCDSSKVTITNQRKIRKAKKSDKFTIDHNEHKRKRQKTLNNWKILMGPCGSSKTATVYALCEQYNIEVIEWNASSFRTGKTLLQKFHEATQSYHVNNTKIIKHFNNLTSERTMSLILIKDFDIVFEDYDDGFLQALNSLISASKRPIILITSSDDFLYMENQSVFKFLDRTDKDHVLQFTRPTIEHLKPFFQILLLVTEKVLINDETLNTLVTIFHNDIRRLFVQLEFWFKDFYRHNLRLDMSAVLKNLLNDFDVERNWWQFQRKIDVSNTADHHFSLNKIRSDLDCFSLSDVWLTKCAKSNSNCLLNFNENCYRNDMSLNDCTEMYSSSLDMIDEIAEFLWTRSWGYSENKAEAVQLMYTSVLDKRKRISASKIFQKAISEFSYRFDFDANVVLDYLPYLRQINRSEHDRCQKLNNKMRFRNYLKKFHIYVDDLHNSDFLQFNLSSFHIDKFQ